MRMRRPVAASVAQRQGESGPHLARRVRLVASSCLLRRAASVWNRRRHRVEQNRWRRPARRGRNRLLQPGRSHAWSVGEGLSDPWSNAPRLTEGLTAASGAESRDGRYPPFAAPEATDMLPPPYTAGAPTRERGRPAVTRNGPFPAGLRLRR